jgi:hypothetical protein
MLRRRLRRFGCLVAQFMPQASSDLHALGTRPRSGRRRRGSAVGGSDRRVEAQGGGVRPGEEVHAGRRRPRSSRTGSRATARTVRPTSRSRTGRKRPSATTRPSTPAAPSSSASRKAREQAEKERDEAKQAADEAHAGGAEDTRRSKIVEAASKAGAIDPDEVHALLEARDFAVKRRASDGAETELKVTIGDDGQVTGVEDVVKAFLGEKKHLVGKARRPDWDGGPRDPAPDDNELADLKDPKAVREAVSKL